MTGEKAQDKAPPPRPGPRPLNLHLALQGMTWLASRNALPFLRSGWRPWNPAQAAEVESLARELAAADPEALAAAVDAEAAARLARFLDGVAQYRRHPAGARAADAPVAWMEGTTRLLDYGAGHTQAKDGAPVLVIPSLINRYYVLDLAPGRSLVAGLVERGLRPFVVDWSAPGPAEQAFTLTDYIAGRLERALNAVLEACGRPAAALGYCMGGLLAVGLAARRPRDVAALALLATPWDFDGVPAAKRQALAAAMPGLEAAMALFNALPVDLLQALFATLDPWLTVRKFRRFAEGGGAAEGSDLFVALEDWLNDGVPLVAPVAREALGGWYGRNTPARGTWMVAGAPVEPAAVEKPALVLIPSRDHIVPPETAWPLAQALPRAEARAVSAGHIGMVAGGRGPELVHAPLAGWLHERMA